MKHWKPGTDEPGYHERRKTPVYSLLTNEGDPRSIVVNQFEALHTLDRDEAKTSEALVSSGSSSEDAEMTDEDDTNFPESSQTSQSHPETSIRHRSAKVLISVALEEDQYLHQHEWLEWLKSVPAITKAATVEGIYESDSTLMSLTISVATWNLLPKNLAIKFLGFVRSRDLLKCSLPGSSTGDACQTGNDPVSKPLSLDNAIFDRSLAPEELAHAWPDSGTHSNGVANRVPRLRFSPTSKFLGQNGEESAHHE